MPAGARPRAPPAKRWRKRCREQPGLDVRVRETRGGPDGTMITSVIEDALSDVARDRIGGVVVVTDGQAADPPAEPRRLARAWPGAHPHRRRSAARATAGSNSISAPTFGIVGEPMRITGRVIDNVGNAPVRVSVSIDGAARRRRSTCAPTSAFSVDVRLPHRGRNMVIVEAAAGAEEITLANNRAGLRRQRRARPAARAARSPASRTRARACGAIC